MKYSILNCLLILVVSQSVAQNSVIINDQSSNAHFEVPDQSAIDFSNEFTIEAWVNINQRVEGTYHTVVHKGWCGSNNGGYHLTVKDNKLSFAWSPTGNCNNNGGYSTVDEVINEGTCYHIAVTFSQSEINFYVNGVSVPGQLNSGSIAPTINNNEPLRIGGYKSQSGTIGNYFIGELDELRLWNVARTSQEIADNYNVEIQTPPSSLIAYYNFNSFTSGASTLTNQSSLGSALDASTTVNNNYPLSNPSCFTSTLSVSKEIDKTSELIVFPNPANEKITIKNINREDITSLKMVSMDGKEVFNSLLINTNEIDVMHLEKGVYVLFIGTLKDDVVLRKVIID